MCLRISISIPKHIDYVSIHIIKQYKIVMLDLSIFVVNKSNMVMVHERIKELITALDSNVLRFSKRTGIDDQTLYKMLTKGTKPSFDTIEAILREYPTVNPRWLLLGEGEIFDGGVADLLKELETLRSAVADKDRIIRLQERQIKIAGVMEEDDK